MLYKTNIISVSNGNNIKYIYYRSFLLRKNQFSDYTEDKIEI